MKSKLMHLSLLAAMILLILCAPSSSAQVESCPNINPGSSEDKYRQELLQHHININNCPCTATGFCLGCTSVGGLELLTVAGIEAFQSEFGQSLVITGGSECGHSSRHSNGFKIDLGKGSNPNWSAITGYITSNPSYKRIGNRAGDNAPQYTRLLGAIFSGAVFALEGEGGANAHWDIDFGSNLTATLTVEKSGEGGGRIVSGPQGIDCGSICSQLFLKTSIDTKSIGLNARADIDSRFVGWTDVTFALGPFAIASVDADKVITARFEKKGDSPPDGDPTCWTWDPTASLNRGAWLWTCQNPPPQAGGRRPQGNGCWHWDETVGSLGGWVFDICGGDRRPTTIARLSGTLIVSGDPNDKVGGQGVGASHYISGEDPLRYAVYFENKKEATAPTEDIVISDQLDITKADLSTFSFGTITFADNLITPLTGLSEFNTDVDLRPKNNLIVRINAMLDKGSGLLTWRFSSIDPDTGQPPEDPFAGFLPPGVDGSVFFTVMPKKELSTGTVVRNKATIIFDVNPPMDTPEWFNTLDNTKPTSHVLPLTATQNSATFNVQWAGTDVGSGVRDFAVYVSDDGGPFNPWLTQTTSTQAVFSGVADHTYSFFSVARDLTGNLEETKAAAETTTQVVINRFPVAKAKNITLVAGSSCQAIVNSNDVNDGSFDPDGDQITLALAPAGPFGLGSHTVTLIVTDSHGASSSSNAVVKVVDQTPPKITAPPPLTFKTGDTATSCGVVISDATLGTVTVTDNCSGVAVTRSGVPAGNFFPVGITTIRYRATDASGNTATATQAVTVIDNTSPSITNVSVSPSSIWPPNHKMVNVTVNYATKDNCDPASRLTNKLSVSSKQSTAADWQVIDAHHLLLRADKGNVYIITISSTDSRGNKVSKNVTISVPHDQGK